MSFTIRQICLVAHKLRSLSLRTFVMFFGIENCYSDPQVEFFGLENALLPVVSDFIEIVSPIKDKTTAGRYLERRKGDGGYMILLQSDSKKIQSSSLTRAKNMGIRVAFEITLETYHLIQLHPADTGGSFLQIDWDAKNEHVGYWYNAGGNIWKEYVNTSVISALTAVEIQSEKPEPLAHRWAEILGVPINIGGKNTLELNLNNGSIRFVTPKDDRGEGLSAIDVKTTDREKLLKSADNRGLKVSDYHVMIGGVRFNLV
ncbi:MAG: hypothetical protein R2860_11250 [Desulfobacterales bacterium]